MLEEDEAQEEPVPLQDAEELYTWYLSRAASRSTIQPEADLRKLYMNSSFPDRVTIDSISAHHTAAVAPWTSSS
eukprot:2906489-Pyramimonas_sp.AAC.1